MTADSNGNGRVVDKPASVTRRGWWLLATTLCLLLGTAVYFSHMGALRTRFLMANPDAIPDDPVLLRYAMSRGKPAFADHCASCHGARLEGDHDRGIPDLADDDWLYGTGRVSEIERVVMYGIRSGHAKGWDLAGMPAFATANPYKRYKITPLTPREIDDVTLYLLTFTHRESDADAVARGSRIYHSNGLCFDCHEADARGDPAIGAPDLTDGIWLYGDGSPQRIKASIAHGLAGTCPAWFDQLPPDTIRALAVYVHSISGNHGHRQPQSVANHG